MKNRTNSRGRQQRFITDVGTPLAAIKTMLNLFISKPQRLIRYISLKQKRWNPEDSIFCNLYIIINYYKDELLLLLEPPYQYLLQNTSYQIYLHYNLHPNEVLLFHFAKHYDQESPQSNNYYLNQK